MQLDKIYFTEIIFVKTAILPYAKELK